MICLRCRQDIPTLVELQVCPDHPGTDPIPWPIPHMCNHKLPCHGPAMSRSNENQCSKCIDRLIGIFHHRGIEGILRDE
jgi:hypothetical protein